VSMSVCAIVPIKIDSRRLPNKNFLLLGDRPLAHHIFETLLSVEMIDEVFAFSSDPRLIEFLPAGVKWLSRVSGLDSDNTKANELFRAAVESVPHDIIVLAQAPGPFVKRDSVIQAVEAIRNDGFDCAATVSRHQTYAWFQGEPLNYDPKQIEQTQNIEPVFVETSGLYAFTNSGYKLNGSRIFGKVKRIEVDNVEAIDIDNPSDFHLAQQIVFAKNFTKFAENPNQSLEKIKSLERIKHICFDLDGVLIDSLSVMEKAWNFATEGLNLDVHFSAYKSQIGIPFENILLNLRIHESLWPEIKDKYNNQSNLFMKQIQPYPGVSDGLHELSKAGFKLSLFTSKSRSRTIQITEEYFPDIFTKVITPDDLPNGRGKPNPDGLLLACTESQCSPGESLYVGDMSVDFGAALAAGVTFIYAGWGYGSKDLRSKVWFDSFESLVDWLVNLTDQPMKVAKT
jgi:HAD superfamily hydrolase (TIGR01549 family)